VVSPRGLLLRRLEGAGYLMVQDGVAAGRGRPELRYDLSAVTRLAYEPLSS